MTGSSTNKLRDYDAGPRACAIWKNLINCYPKETIYGPANKQRFRRRPLEDLGLVIGQYLSFEGDEVGVYVTGKTVADAAQTKARLEPFARELTEALRVKFLGQNKKFFPDAKEFRTKDGSQWGEMVRWLHDRASEYERALRRVMEKG